MTLLCPMQFVGDAGFDPGTFDFVTRESFEATEFD